MVYKVLAAPLGRIMAPSPLAGVLLQGPASSANLGIEMAAPRPLAGSFIGSSDLGEVTEAQASAIRARIDAVLAKMDEAMSVAEFEWAAVADPAKRSSIADVGNLGEGAVLSAVVMLARAVVAAVNAFADGVAGAYTTAIQQGKVGEVNGRGSDVVEFSSGATPLVENSEEWNAAQLHVARHMDPIEDLVAQVEKEIVAAESGGIGVREPAEKTKDLLVGGGILAAGGILAYILLS